MNDQFQNFSIVKYDMNSLVDWLFERIPERWSKTDVNSSSEFALKYMEVFDTLPICRSKLS